MKEKIEEKLKSVLHRRKKSTPTQSPRASYEQSAETSPRTEQHPISPRNRRQQHSEITNDAFHPDTRGQPRDSAYHDGRANHAVASPNTDLNGSIADDYRSYLPALASEDDLTAEQGVPDRHLRYRPSSDAERLKPLPAIPSTLQSWSDHCNATLTWQQIPLVITTLITQGDPSMPVALVAQYVQYHPNPPDTKSAMAALKIAFDRTERAFRMRSMA
jgi:hypothetical protein